jgi:endonuclease/exonuclease/phosphatase family metal-dependent hydrolase
MKQLYFLLLLMPGFLWSCNERQYSSPGPSLIYLTFDGEISNSGILPVEFQGNKYVSYGSGISDSCLNLSGNSRYRKPVIIDKGPSNSFSDYEGISFMVWVKTNSDDPNKYVIAGQKQRTTNNFFKGWEIMKTMTGGWTWEFSDGYETLSYSPTHTHQPIDDGQWHQIGFTINKRLKEARFFYDGNLKAVFSTEGVNITFPGTRLFAGSDPLMDDLHTETFNGMIDEMGVWSRILTNDQVAGLYRQNSQKKLKPLPVCKDSLTIMTWNIWNGARYQGKYVGVKRVAEIIRASGADIVAIQETMGSGGMIAGELDYYLYHRSPNLSIVSRYLPGKSYNAFRPMHFGALQVNLGESKNVVVGPLWLSRHPNLSAYFMKDNASVDSVITREMESRGVETNFLLSEIRPFIQNSETTPVIIAGDFNSGSHLDWTERTKNKHNNLVINFPASQHMMDEGFKDAYRELFPDEAKWPGHTRSPLFGEGIQTRMDFIYYRGNRLTPTSAKVIDAHPYGFPSNHSAVMVSFKLE